MKILLQGRRTSNALLQDYMSLSLLLSGFDHRLLGLFELSFSALRKRLLLTYEVLNSVTMAEPESLLTSMLGSEAEQILNGPPAALYDIVMAVELPPLEPLPQIQRGMSLKAHKKCCHSIN